MEFRQLGNTGIQLSALSFGASSLGQEFREVDLSEAIRSVRVALDAGMNFIDTSPYYGRGTSECLLGFAFFESPTLLVVLSSGVTMMLSLCVGALAVYTNEAFPTEVRSTGLAINNVSRSVIGLGGPYFCGLYATSDPQLALVVFAVSAFVGAVTAACLPIETKGQRLMDRAAGSE